ncbi:hypothetical protein L484_009467 [Morus notabilis]|uniref:B-like cyclin n=1 Tax=Morus notabilis TaxID=981085 RepID=W9S4N0_9ROSA|nr:hypothetical protein L484_009467 [Morus notabilis]
MESLLCDEVWPFSSPIENELVEKTTLHGEDHNGEYCCHMSMEDCEQALTISLEDEKSYAITPKYLEYLASKKLIVPRFKSIQWFIKCRSRLNLCFETVFYATNYLDRFILSMNQCNIEWKYWMVELLSVACISIASKFSDTTTPTLHEINLNMEDMEHLFQPSTIQRMELMILQALDWRLACATAYSYVEMFTRALHVTSNVKPHLQQEIVAQVNDLLLRAISDKLHPTAPITLPSSLAGFFNQDQKDDLVRCHNTMEMQWINGTTLLDDEGQYCYNYCPSSPTTVLLKERINLPDFNVDLSLFHIQRPQFNLDPSISKKKPRRSEGLYMNQ